MLERNGFMTRAEMLNRLSKVEYTELWPEDDWEDVNGTELQIWINGNGYGFFNHDDQIYCYKLAGVPDQKWKDIREKLKDRKLSIDDVQGTSITKLGFFEVYDPSDPCDLNELLKGLLLLPDSLGEFFYCADTFDDYHFFDTEEETYEYVKRDECDTKWEELADDELAEWIKRLETIDMGIGFFDESL